MAYETATNAIQARTPSVASYFPSIEKKYGKPISHWKSLLKKMKSAKHSEMVAMLKTKHEMGHGHANAIVAHFRAEEGL